MRHIKKKILIFACLLAGIAASLFLLVWAGPSLLWPVTDRTFATTESAVTEEAIPRRLGVIHLKNLKIRTLEGQRGRDIYLIADYEDREQFRKDINQFGVTELGSEAKLPIDVARWIDEGMVDANDLKTWNWNEVVELAAQANENNISFHVNQSERKCLIRVIAFYGDK